MNKIKKYQNKHYVYLHIDPRDSQVYYVGKGSYNRAWIKCNRSPEHKGWFQDLKQHNLNPIIKIAHVFDDAKDALIRERILIAFLLEIEHPLFNINKGGGGHPGGPGHPKSGTKASPETKKKISEALKGKPKPNLSEPTRLRMLGNTIKKGTKSKKETKEKISKSLIGNRRRSISIFCINNGKTYKSIREAWIELSLDERSVFRVLKGEWIHTKGYKFIYV